MSDQTWEAYAEAGVERALALGNRGPVRFDDNGRLLQDIGPRTGRASRIPTAPASATATA